jgi:uncharacterized damage-inducible protein DinB
MFQRQYKRLAWMLFALPFAAGSLFAQAGQNPLSTGNLFVYSLVKGNIIKAAEEMPESDYGFKPTPDVRSFGQLVGHVADAQFTFCAPALGEQPKPASAEKTKTTKADLIQALKAGFAYCDTAYKGLTDAHAADMVNFFGHDTAKLSLLTFSSAHDDEHHGNMVTYLRLKGLVPPSSAPTK